MINAEVTVTDAEVTAADVAAAAVSTEQAAIATATCLLPGRSYAALNSNFLQVKICIPVGSVLAHLLLATTSVSTVVIIVINASDF